LLEAKFPKLVIGTYRYQYGGWDWKKTYTVSLLTPHKFQVQRLAAQKKKSTGQQFSAEALLSPPA